MLKVGLRVEEARANVVVSASFCARYLSRHIVPVVKSLSRVIKSGGAALSQTRGAEGACEAECYGSSFNSFVELLAYQQRDTTTLSRNRSTNNPHHVASRLYGLTVKQAFIFPANAFHHAAIKLKVSLKFQTNQLSDSKVFFFFFLLSHALSRERM